MRRFKLKIRLYILTNPPDVILLPTYLIVNYVKTYLSKEQVLNMNKAQILVHKIYFILLNNLLYTYLNNLINKIHGR